MTPEEVGRALGEGWRWQPGWRGAPGVWQWYPKGPESAGVEVEDADDGINGWTVSLQGDEGGATTFGAMPPEHAVAVAHLLVAAEKIAGGAEVAAHRLTSVGAFATFPHGVWVGSDRITSQSARRLAIDLLAAADAAESTPTEDAG